MRNPRDKLEVTIRQFDTDGGLIFHQQSNKITISDLMVVLYAMHIRSHDNAVRMTVDIAFPQEGK